MVYIGRVLGIIDRNRSELKTLEHLAESAQEGRFYFVPGTPRIFIVSGRAPIGEESE
jgi:hypothetical protein